MSMGGSSGGQAPSKLYFRNISKEAPTVSNWIERMTQQDFPNFYQHDPIWSGLYDRAAQYGASGPSQLLQQLQGGAEDLQQYGMNQLQAGPSDLLTTMQRQSREDLMGRGELNDRQNRDVRNDSLATAGAMGMGFSPGTLGTELLDREKYRQQRYQQAQQYATGTEGLSQSDEANRFNIAAGGQSALGQAQQLTDADIAQHFQIPMQVAQGAAQTFQGFSNPILQYLGQAFTPTVYGGGSQGDNGMAGIGQLAGTIIGAIATAYSDERLKENIADTGTKTPEGIPIKDFNYLGDKRRFRGVIAQDVERITPAAVITHPGTGYKMVDYGQIATRLYELNKGELTYV